jgi:hypothetical protein
MSGMVVWAAASLNPSDSPQRVKLHDARLMAALLSVLMFSGTTVAN